MGETTDERDLVVAQPAAVKHLVADRRSGGTLLKVGHFHPDYPTVSQVGGSQGQTSSLIAQLGQQLEAVVGNEHRPEAPVQAESPHVPGEEAGSALLRSAREPGLLPGGERHHRRVDVEADQVDAGGGEAERDTSRA